MDVDAEMDSEEAAVCGSSSFCAAAAVTDVEEAATLAADAEMTAVCGSSFFCAAAAALAETDAANLLIFMIREGIASAVPSRIY